MHFDSILTLLLISTYVIIAIYLFWNNRVDLARIRVGLIALAMTTWLFSNKMLEKADTVFSISLWVRVIFIAAVLIIYLMHIVSASYITFKLKGFKFRNILMHTSLLSVIFIFAFTDLFFTEYNQLGKSAVEKAPTSSFFIVALISFVYTLVSVIINFIYAYKKSNKNIKNQILYIAVSSLAWFLIALITAAILPAMNITHLVPVAPVGALLYILGMSYAVVKYRLLDIEFVIKRTTLYLALISFVTAIYIFVIILTSKFIGIPGSTNSVLVMLITAIVITATIQPLRNWLDGKTDKFFFQKKYDYQKVLEKVAKQLNTVVKMDEAINVVVDPFVNDMHLKGVGIYLREKAGDDAFICHEKVGEISLDLPDAIIDTNPLLTYLSQEMKIVESGEFRYQYGHLYEGGIIRDEGKAAIQAEMDHTFNAGLFIPLVLKKTLIGFIVLGEKKSGDQFTFRDLSLLETVASQLVTSMDNIRLYEQMLNNERLTIIGTMSASIAHEIRNPLASIKTFIQMLPDKVAKPEFIKRFNEIVPAEIERISGITADLLTFSKPSSPSLESVDSRHLLERVVTLLAAQFRKRQIEVVSELQDLPAIQADSQQLFQVFLNMFLNSIQASESGRMIKVSSRMKEDGQSIHKFHESVIYITIEDQGAGIKRKDVINIFQPFFTTKSEGTGLGLATCKRIVDAHRGEIFVESELGMGTKMTVMLPMKLTPEVILSEEVMKN